MNFLFCFGILIGGIGFGLLGDFFLIEFIVLMMIWKYLVGRRLLIIIDFVFGGILLLNIFYGFLFIIFVKYNSIYM